jgi:hypothetical protein
MPTYEVTYTLTTEYIVEVDGDTEDLARDHVHTLIGNYGPADVPHAEANDEDWEIVMIERMDEEA